MNRYDRHVDSGIYPILKRDEPATERNRRKWTIAGCAACISRSADALERNADKETLTLDMCERFEDLVLDQLEQISKAMEKE